MEYKIGSVLEVQYQDECAVDIEVCQDGKQVATIKLKGKIEHVNKLSRGFEAVIKSYLKKLKQ